MQQIKDTQKIATINDNPEKKFDAIFHTLSLSSQETNRESPLIKLFFGITLPDIA